MDRLPTELLPLIARHLERRDLYHCVQVNGLFHTIMTPFLWHTVNITCVLHVGHFLYNVINNTNKYSRLAHSIHHLELALPDWIDEDGTYTKEYPYLVGTMTKLGQSTVDNGLEWVAKHCPYIVTLSIGRIRISRSTFITFGHHLNHLCSLTLTCCFHLPPDLATLLIRLPLKELVIAYSENPSPYYEDDEDADKNDEENNLVDLTGFQHLIHLRLSGDIINKWVDMVLSNMPLPTLWPHLKFLCLERCVDLTNDHLVPLFPCLPALTGFKVTDSTFSDALLDAIATFQPGLVRINLSYCLGLTPRGVRRLVRACPSLVLVVLTYCDMLTEDFPEAGSHCSKVVVRHSQTFIGLDRLDQEAIDKIRLAPEPEKDNNNDDDHGADDF